jgi:hypothetical protein
MRRYIVYLTIALVTFSLSALVAIQTYRRSVSVAPLPAEVVVHPPATKDSSENMPPPPVEQLASPEVPLPVKRELDKRFPGWRFPQINPEIGKYLRENQSPDAHPAFIRGDFDGNGQTDYAALIEYGTACLKGGKTSIETGVVVFLGNGNKFKFHRLNEASEYIALMKKGERDYNYETDKKFTYKNDAVFTGYWEKGGVTFVYERGKFRSIVTSD